MMALYRVGSNPWLEACSSFGGKVSGETEGGRPLRIKTLHTMLLLQAWTMKTRDVLTIIKPICAVFRVDLAISQAPIWQAGSPGSTAEGPRRH